MPWGDSLGPRASCAHLRDTPFLTRLSDSCSINDMSPTAPRLGGPIARPHKDRAGGRPLGLAGRLIRERARRRLSQAAAADEIGANRVTLAEWELGTEPRGLYRRIVDLWLAGAWPPAERG